MNFLLNDIIDHPFLTGTFGTLLLWLLIPYLKELPQYIVNKIKGLFLVSVEISEKDDSYDWVQSWFSKLDYAQKAKRLELRTQFPEIHNDSYSATEILRQIKNRKLLIFSPAKGIHYFKYKGKRTWVSYFKSETTTKSIESTDTEEPSSFVITVIGRTQDRIRDLIKEIQEQQINELREKVDIYTSSGATWRYTNSINLREFSSIVLPDKQLEDFHKDITLFTQNETLYKDLNIPYRRGYLLYGTPGSGKTSTVIALASELQMNLCVLDIGSIWKDRELIELMSLTPPNSIVLIEDVDSYIQFRKISKGINISFSGLLNAIDGVMASDGLIICITTNRIDKLDPALIRTGRIDYKLKFSFADTEQIVKMFKRFFPQANDTQKDEFANNLAGKNITTSDIQSILLKSNFNVDEAIKEAQYFISIDKG